jgi:hypothetical protein
VPTPDNALRHVMQDLAPYEGLLSTVVGVEHREGRPGRRRLVAIATDKRLLVASVRDPAHPQRVPFAQILQATIETDEYGTHLVIDVRAGEPLRIDRLRDPAAGEVFVSLVNARAGTPGGQSVRPSPRVRLVTATD